MLTSKNWTDAQIRNAALYGICMICEEPREIREEEVLFKTGFARKNGEPEFVTITRLTCPNEHTQ